MTSPTVTELPRKLEPVTADPFADGLVEPAPRRSRRPAHADRSLAHPAQEASRKIDARAPRLAAFVVLAAIAVGPVIVDPDVASHAVNVAVIGAR